jgi:hypothetical protein
MQVFAMQDAQSTEFYTSALDILEKASVEFLVGGAFALRTYTGIERYTKDLDLMMRPKDVQRALQAFRDAGFRADYAFSHWLAKAHRGEHFLDIIYRAGNGLCEVDDLWFAHSRETEIFDRALRICPPEEMIWQKAYIMERERYDGADVAHLLRCCATKMDWGRLLERFGQDWRVLLAHLTIFGFVYPGERHLIPEAMLRELHVRASTEGSESLNGTPVCQGTLISRAQYLPDVERWGFADARTKSRKSMTEQEREEWTNAIDREAR